MNKEQQEAIESLDNTLLVAGAGSGKTTTIIKKVDYLIQNKIFTEKDLLIISFTNESVNNVKKRLIYNIDVKTFHKLALNIVNNKDIKICPDNYLSYIIDEYFKSFGKYNKEMSKILKRISYNNYNFKVLIKTFINLYKANYNNIDYLFKIYQKSYFINKDMLKVILDIYLIYIRELEASGLVDFNDMIIKATELIAQKSKFTKYKYIIIDEFQDTSLIRFNLIKEILKQNNGKLFAVGDDFQSIYRFSGCDLNIFLNIKDYVKNVKVIKLKNNYRNSQELIDLANKFIMKNKKQIPKINICFKNINKPVKIIYYIYKKKIINKTIKRIDGNILILGRNNKDKQEFNIKEYNNVKFLTVHKAKGLESDNVILINLENKISSFPSKIKNINLINKIIPKDYIKYEEERRLFYVALTRSKNNVYLIVPKYNPSVFIIELIKNSYNYIEFINDIY